MYCMNYLFRLMSDHPQVHICSLNHIEEEMYIMLVLRNTWNLVTFGLILI